MSTIPVPLQFIENSVLITWADLLWAYKRQLVTWRDLVQFAQGRLLTGSEEVLEVELAKVGKDTVWKVSELAEKLASRDRTADTEIKRKWLFLSLAWSFENRTGTSDPLGTVETIYADFDYPTEIESFVRYMPPTDGYLPSNHSLAENYMRLVAKWKEFLDIRHQEFRK